MTQDQIVGTVFGIVLFVLFAIFIAVLVLEWDRRQVQELLKAHEVEIRKVLWVPAEAWSQFGEIVMPLGNFREHGEVRTDVHKPEKEMFEYAIWPDLVRDGMWFQYICRRMDYEDYIVRNVDYMNKRLERPIEAFEGTVPEEEAMGVG